MSKALIKGNLLALAAFFAGFGLAPAAAMSASAIDVAGHWLTDEGQGKVEIADCGDGTPCGTLVWISPDAEGDSDVYNPDPSLAGRPLIGVQMIWGFERKGDRWKKGKIYDPNDGKTYRSILELQEDGNLKVKGCVGPFCRSLIWTPVPDAE